MCSSWRGCLNQLGWQGHPPLASFAPPYAARRGRVVVCFAFLWMDVPSAEAPAFAGMTVGFLGFARNDRGLRSRRLALGEGGGWVWKLLLLGSFVRRRFGDVWFIAKSVCKRVAVH